MSKFSFLKSFIEFIEDSYDVDVCFHDLTGITTAETVLHLEHHNRIHNCKYCQYVKTIDGFMGKCLQEKIVTINICNKTQKAYLRKCYMNLYEIVFPYFYKGTMLFILYISGFTLKEEWEETKKNIAKKSYKFNFDYDRSISELKSLPMYSHVQIEKLFNTAEILAANIASILEDKELSYNLYNTDEELKLGWKNKRNALMDNLIAYIDMHYRNNLTLESLANLFFINHQYLSRLFKAQNGVNFKDYLISKRIEYSKYQLIYSKKTNSENRLRSRNQRFELLQPRL